jgi:hypothetical protein
MKSAFSVFVVVAIMMLAIPAALAREKDLRTQTDASGVTEIGFCARPSPNSWGFPGHAFVSFSEQRAGQRRIFRAVGHTVAPSITAPAAVFTYFGGGSVAGQQAEERFTHLKQACLTVQVDRARYQDALMAARPTLVILGIPDNVAASAERYSLSGNDCLDFMIRVAQTLRAAGLVVPSRTSTDTPMTFVQKLIAANG